MLDRVSDRRCLTVIEGVGRRTNHEIGEDTQALFAECNHVDPSRLYQCTQQLRVAPAASTVVPKFHGCQISNDDTERQRGQNIG